MFSSFTGRFGQEVNAIKGVLSTNEGLRNLLFSIAPVTSQETPPVTTPGISPYPSMVAHGLTRLDWQIFDHCAAFTRLYAIYEQFITDIITEYLRTLPQIYPSYSELPDSCKTQHRAAVGQILQKWSEDGHYNTLTELGIVQGLADGLAGRVYTLLPQAFLIDPQNYRAEILRRLFKYLGFDDGLTFVKRFPSMVEFMGTSRDATETIETVLHDFVEQRNEASHQSVTQTVGLSGIFSFADFLVILCRALAEMLERRVLRRYLELGHLVRVGEVVHRYSNNVVGVRATGGPVSAGERLVAAASKSAFFVTLRSIQSGPTPYDSITLLPGQEIGFGLDSPLTVGIALYKTSATTGPRHSASPSPPAGASLFEI